MVVLPLRVTGGYAVVIVSFILVKLVDFPLISAVNHDDFISRFKLLTLGREAVLCQVSRG
jgi:phosphoribulokinase